MSQPHRRTTPTPRSGRAPVPVQALVRPRAVIDIGSNSVRLVVYDGPLRAPFPVCNEKALCGLGRGDGVHLPPAARAATLSVLRRFRRLLDEFHDPEVNAFATAAVRDARDGADFLAEVARETGFEVRILTGPEEARFAALGVVAAAPDASGLVGDLGGASLELVGVTQGDASEGRSLPIGPLRVLAATGGDLARARAHVEKAIAHESWLKDFKGRPLYTVGGAWRAIARVAMARKDYPLSVLHAYRIPAREAIEDCDLIARQSAKSLESIPGVSRKRIEVLPFAAILMRTVLRASGASAVVVSAGGVREGVLFDRLGADDRARDPLLESATWLGARFFPMRGAAEAFTAGLFPQETAEEARLRHAACRLADSAAYIHPDHRARHAFDLALRASLTGIDHAGRIFAGLALYRRYQGRGGDDPSPRLSAILAPEVAQRALRLGLALRFASALAPKAPGVLAECRLALADGKVIFEAPESVRALLTENADRKFAALADAFQAERDVSFV